MVTRSVEIVSILASTYIFVDTESVSLSFDEVATDPVSYWCQKVGCEPMDSVVICYSKSLHELDDLMLQRSNTIGNFFWYVIPGKNNHEVVDKAIVLDTMFFAANATRHRDRSSRKLILVSNDKDFYELIQHLSVFLDQPVLYTEKEVDIELQSKCDFANVRSLRGYGTVDNLVDEALYSNVNNVAAANLPDLLLPADIDTPKPSTSMIPRLFRGVCTDPMPSPPSDEISGVHVSVWEERLKSYFANVGGYLVYINGTKHQTTVYEYSQLGTATRNVVKVPTSKSAKRAAMKHVTIELINKLVIIPVEIVSSEYGRPTVVQYFENMDSSYPSELQSLYFLIA